MKLLLGLLLGLLLASCSGKTSTETFISESGLQMCPNVILRQTLPAKPEGEIDYIYTIRLDRIGGCSTITSAGLERSGYICTQTSNGSTCSKIFEDGSIAQLRLSGNSAVFSRRHNR